MGDFTRDPRHIYTVELQDVTLGYAGRVLFEGADIGFGWGEFTALIGRNGTGKSTLLRTIAALHKPLGGRILVGGHPLDAMTPRQIAETIGFVSTDEVRVTNLRVRDIVALGRAPYTDWIGRLTPDDRRKVDEALELVGMGSFAEKGIDTLSDGERQRVMIARALAQDTPVILLDEPTAFLDVPNRYEICLLLRRLAHRQGKCILFSTHDLGIALEMCDTIAMIEQGRFRYGTPAEMISGGEIQQLFRDTSLYFDAEQRTVRYRREG